ncbi:DoxX family protein [Mucilaginibacter terrigena]|uniref:DoxX family protein n=1 Tax=Mucilaginibacter terrigena TaxID=2492395 RepID=A0A4Q5LIQ1_9SPHI|nr:DoxX family protein [Mucilaginibacter terrigena]RYU89248.1 DoxX family protein [Mucilaginibacter terrigena]
MNGRNINIGLLVLRIGIGSMFILHGWPKLQGGIAGWERLGNNMQYIGISFLPAFWGFMAMAAELVGGICLVLGVGVRVASALMLFTMFVAAAGNLSQGYGLEGVVEITEVSSALFMLLIVGAGQWTVLDAVRRITGGCLQTRGDITL